MNNTRYHRPHTTLTIRQTVSIFTVACQSIVSPASSGKRKDDSNASPSSVTLGLFLIHRRSSSCLANPFGPAPKRDASLRLHTRRRRKEAHRPGSRPVSSTQATRQNQLLDSPSTRKVYLAILILGDHQILSASDHLIERATLAAMPAAESQARPIQAAKGAKLLARGQSTDGLLKKLKVRIVVLLCSQDLTTDHVLNASSILTGIAIRAG